MDQFDSNLTERRFIFSDAFYDQMENMNKSEETPIEPEVSIPEKIETPVENSVLDNLNTISQENNDISNDLPGSNAFFNNQVIKTTTVYDNVGNTISKTIDDGNEEQVIIAPPEVEETPEEDNLPNLGIPKPKDMPEVVEVEKPDLMDIVPNTTENDNKLNVETGIDTNLEQQLMSNKQEYIPQTNFFDIPPVSAQQEVKPYRAVRRQINTQLLDSDDTEEKTVDIQPLEDIREKEKEEIEDTWVPSDNPAPIEITEEINYEEPIVEEHVTKSTLLDELQEKENTEGKISILARYGDDFTSHDYITNPAIGRDKEIKELGLILLTPEKSAILVGKPGIGKTSIVEGLAYQLQRDNVPDALKGFRIISIKTTSLLGGLANGETRLQTLIDELKTLDKIILFIDEVHMLMGATNESSLDFANMFKEALGRGSIKMIGATTSEEYERYVLRDKAFVRRFQRVDVAEPSREETIEILMGTLPKIEKTTGAKLKYTYFIKTEIMAFITDITTEYKRVYGIGSRYPDICITLLNQAFSEAVFNNRNEVNIFDIRSAIENSKNIYPDVIRKELVNFDKKFKNIIDEENNQ